MKRFSKAGHYRAERNRAQNTHQTLRIFVYGGKSLKI
jgi:hypothetical protein